MAGDVDELLVGDRVTTEAVRRHVADVVGAQHPRGNRGSEALLAVGGILVGRSQLLAGLRNPRPFNGLR